MIPRDDILLKDVIPTNKNRMPHWHVKQPLNNFGIKYAIKLQRGDIWKRKRKKHLAIF